VGGRSARHAWTAARALALVETGAIDAGRAAYETLAADSARAVPRDWYWLLTVVLLAEACCELGDRERAHELYDLLEPYGDRFTQVIFAANWGSVHRQLGMLATVLERFDAAERHFLAGLEADQRVGAIVMTAATQCAYGALLRVRGAPGDREQAAALAARVVAVAAPRGLDDLCRRAQRLIAADPA
jgi:tetratricopeptide (TPR) repeat protein